MELDWTEALWKNKTSSDRTCFSLWSGQVENPVLHKCFCREHFSRWNQRVSLRSNLVVSESDQGRITTTMRTDTPRFCMVSIFLKLQTFQTARLLSTLDRQLFFSRKGKKKAKTGDLCFLFCLSFWLINRKNIIFSDGHVCKKIAS